MIAFAIKGDIDEKVGVGQDPLQGGSELLIVIHHENGLSSKVLPFSCSGSGSGFIALPCLAQQ
ncbi:MAG: hypothetical protein H0W66_00905 [Chthoniobacterales bacterium]|nr:hypothetical protein [Chthoniobacterales bacterium]